MSARLKGIILIAAIFAVAMLSMAQIKQTPSTAFTAITQPSPTPFPTPVPSPSPTPAPSPTPSPIPSPTPFPTPSPSPTPVPTPPPACTNPLASLDPVALGLDTSVEDPIMAPTEDADPGFSGYIISGSFLSATQVGVVLPAYGAYTISPVASTVPDLSYDVSGCWGPYGAMVFAQPGLYTFLALGAAAPNPSPTPVAAPAGLAASSEQVGAIAFVEPPAVVLGAGLAPKESELCFTDPATLARAKAVEYPPLGATVAGGKTGQMIDDTNDAAILLAQKVLTSMTIQFQKVGGTNPAIDDMVSNIGTVFTNNASKPIIAAEVGHGSPNTWTNVGSIFQLNYGTTPATPSDALKSLEGTAGKISTFDVFSCFVGKGVAPKGALNTNHILAHLAANLVVGAAQVDTRGVNVPIFIITPVGKRAGSFALKNTDPDTKNAATATVSCKGPAPVACTVKVTELLK